MTSPRSSIIESADMALLFIPAGRLFIGETTLATFFFSVINLQIL
ncbi:unnamed protein product [Acidithrix sp. C25]|nr:unnamed protein product [Acidithrix sp. C25]